MPSITASENVALVVTAAAALAATGALALTLWSKARDVRGTGAPLLRGFRLTRVLKVAEREVSLLGTFASDPLAREAVVTIQKTAFDTRELETLLQSLSLHTILENDIYSTYVGDVSRAVKPFKVNVIHPATETHVRKHSDQQFHMVVETQELYERVTRIFIRTSPKEKIEWVYNILDQYVAADKGLEFKGFLTDEEVLPPCSRTESERIVFEDTHPTNGFILLPDFKWSDTSNLESIYCLAIINNRSVFSLRDLRAEHLPMLKNVRDASLQAIAEHFGVRASALRVYVHYQPTYYHFHVHFSHVKITDGTHTGKAVLLEDIIYNLSRDGDYYRHASLTYVIGEMQHKPLYDLFVEHGVFGPKRA